MTSLSLKKHQTIRLSTLGAIEPRQGLVTAVAVVVLACWSASLQAAPWQALFGGIPAAADAEPAERIMGGLGDAGDGEHGGSDPRFGGRQGRT